MVKVVIVKNSLDPFGSQEIFNMLQGLTVKQYSDVLLPKLSSNYDIASSVDGHIIDDTDIILKDNQSLALVAVPQGSGSRGGTGKSIMAIIGMVVIAAASYGVGAAVAGSAWAGATAGTGAAAGTMVATTTSGMIGAAAAAMTSIAGSLILNALLPVQSNTSLADNSSPTYGWGPGENAIMEGTALPTLYGTVRVTPPRIAMFINQYDQVQVLGLLFAVAGHEIDSMTDIQINDTKDPVNNFPNVMVYTRLGTNDNEMVPYFNDTTTLVTDRLPGNKLDLEWRTFTTQGDCFTKLTFGFVFFQGLFGISTDDQGNFEIGFGANLEYKLETSNTWIPFYSEGTNVPAIMMVANNTSTLRYAFTLPRLTEGRYNFRIKVMEEQFITRTGSSDWNSMQDCCLEYYSETIEDDFIYPGVALLSVQVPATEKLSNSIPRITCIASRSIIYVKDPDGNYLQKSATNPAWVCYDILCGIKYVMNMHNNLYEYYEGGPVEPERIIYSDFEDWAYYCDQNAPSENPGKKPYTCNIYMDTIQTTRKALDMIGLLGRGVVIQQGSRWGCIVDRPEQAGVQRFCFNMANIQENSFNEQWLAMDERANSLQITFYDAEYDWQSTTLEIKQIGYDESLNEVKTTSIDYRGCTNKDMALAYARYLLNCNRYLTLTCSWTAFIDSIACYPGQIIELQHDVPQYGYGGRLLDGCTRTILYLDIDVTMIQDDWLVYCVIVYHQEDDLREQLNVVQVPGTSNVLNLSGALSRIPSRDSKFQFGEVGKVNKLMRVIKITRASDTVRKLTCIEFVNAVFQDYMPISPINTSAIVENLALPALESLKYELIWILNSLDKIWYPYFRITPVFNPRINYINLPIPISKIRIYNHVESGNTSESDISVTTFETSFDINPGVYETSASDFINETVYATATIVDTEGNESPRSPIAVLYVNNQTTTPLLALDTQIDLSMGTMGYTFYSTVYTVYIKWNPVGWELINGKYAPILRLNDGNNYYAFQSHMIVYGRVNNLGDIPNFNELTTVTTSNIGDIYDAYGQIITNTDLLDNICRTAVSTHIDSISYASTYYAIATIPILKTGETCCLDFGQPGYGLDWVYAYAETPGTIGDTIDESMVTDFGLVTTMEPGSEFISEIHWSYLLGAPLIDGFALIYRSQPYQWAWELNQTVSISETSLTTIKNSLDQTSIGGLESYNNFVETITDWISSIQTPFIYLSISDTTNYEIIRIDVVNAVAVRGTEGTTARQWGTGSVLSYIPCEYLDTIEYIPNPEARSYTLNTCSDMSSAIHMSLVSIKNIAEDPGYRRTNYALLDSVRNR